MPQCKASTVVIHKVDHISPFELLSPQSPCTNGWVQFGLPNDLLFLPVLNQSGLHFLFHVSAKSGRFLREGIYHYSSISSPYFFMSSISEGEDGWSFVSDNDSPGFGSMQQ